VAALFNVDIERHKRFEHRFARAYTNAGAKFRKVLKKEVEFVLDKAKYYTPVDTGALRNSGKIIVNKQTKQTTSYTIQFGNGLDHEYAWWVEVREFSMVSGKKIYHAPPTRALYAQTAHDENIDNLRQKMAEITKILREDYKRS
jgi:hypothetical protein